MTPRERVLAAFRFEKTDKVPVHHVGFSSDVASALIGREAYVGGGIQQWREATAHWNGPDAHAEFVERSYRDAIDVALASGNDIIRPSYWRYDRKPTKKIDDYTFLYEYGPEEDWRSSSTTPAVSSATSSTTSGLNTFDTIQREVAARKSGRLSTPESSDSFEQRAKRAGRRVRDPQVGLGVPAASRSDGSAALRPI